jgi:hypothetical protein
MSLCPKGGSGQSCCCRRAMTTKSALDLDVPSYLRCQGETERRGASPPAVFTGGGTTGSACSGGWGLRQNLCCCVLGANRGGRNGRGGGERSVSR